MFLTTALAALQRGTRPTRLAWFALACVLLLGVAACDRQRISELEEGLSTEADVRAKFGEPQAIWDEPDGSRVLEFDRQPAGNTNYMITIGKDGRMSALRQVLSPVYFSKITPGMPMEQVRRLLGKPAKQMKLAASGETAWDWRYLSDPNTVMVFTVWFDKDMYVLRSASAMEMPKGGR